jgi:histidyl-tRNA synthetase
MPADKEVWAEVESIARAIGGAYGYREIETPIIEPATLIERLGASTDVVQKELFRFQDRGGDWLVLRPEATAGVVRAYFQNGLQQETQPVRVYQIGSMFRYDRPQKGRYRQFHQFDVEAIGDESPGLDSEVIEIAWRWMAEVGLRGVSLHLNSIGDRNCRPAYLDRLLGYYRPLSDQLHSDCQRRLEDNPLRLLDCKEAQCQPFKAGAPRILDHLCSECAMAFDEVRELLREAKIDFEINPFLVRGLDYYTRTVFEFVDQARGGAQNALGGGGRYDGLAEALGWAPTPAVGFGMGLDRVVEALAAVGDEEGGNPLSGLAVLPDGSGLSGAAAEVGRKARVATPSVIDYSQRSLKAKMRSANRSGVRYVAIVNAAEASRRVVQLKDMETAAQVEVPWDDLGRWLMEQPTH